MIIHAEKRPTNEHRRRYNAPESSEVAAIVPGPEDGEVGRRVIVLRKRGRVNSNGNEVLETMDVTHRSCDALSYVLLLPFGCDGWHRELRMESGGDGRRGRKITPLMFYAYRLFERCGEFSALVHACRLFQQYVVDQYCKMEAERLSYIRQNQETLRAADYTALQELLADANAHENETDMVRAGRLFVLPSTYVGGYRYMKQQMFDVIAMSNKLGHPDFFVTMTCNPNWPEIKRELKEGQKACDRPDLCARVFHMKCKDIIKFVQEEEIFGKVVGFVVVIEFQKRGLPHAHCMFFLDAESKARLQNPDVIDEMVFAELPPEGHPLHEVIATDQLWKATLGDAFRSNFVALSEMFATILTHCMPSKPLELWTGCGVMFLTDMRNRHRGLSNLLRDEEYALNHLLREVQESLLAMSGPTLRYLGLPDVPSNLAPLPVRAEEEVETLEDLCLKAVEAVYRFNADQKRVFNYVVGAIIPGVTCDDLIGEDDDMMEARNGPRVFFLDAPGVTGKTFVTNVIQRFLEGRGKKVIAVSSSAVAAQLLRKGRTAHSVFKIPIPCMSDSTCRILPNTDLEDTVKGVDLIIWDEICMSHRYNIEAVERTLRDVMRNEMPFGGKVVLFTGDFRQILPVIPRASRPQIVSGCFNKSSVFCWFKALKLSINMRLQALRDDPMAAPEDLEFPGYLLKVGDGMAQTTETEHIQLPQSVHLVDTIQELSETVFEGIEENFHDLEWLTSRAVITTRNGHLPEVNHFVSSRITGTSKLYISHDYVLLQEAEEGAEYPQEFLNTLTAGSALPDHKLYLKKGIMVMLLRNIDPAGAT